MTSRRVTLAEAKLNLNELLEELASDDGELLIELNDDLVFVVLPLEAYDPKRLALERVVRVMEEAGRRSNLETV
ncbi:MAG: hypothetical protein QOH93_676 [Chloroflexia bacterium]|jgi:PHD/YefM family antitoxin component YafN of YafNO toxin-antitoxin module|nr:hypothetical protein [Chloroflexia bacterium]